MKNLKPVILTGATGYIGGCLLKVLQSKGVPVRCLLRDPGRLHLADTANVELVKADLLKTYDLSEIMAGSSTAFYLVHSMAAKSNFAELDRKAAQNFAHAAKQAGVSRIIYLGGLGNEQEGLSEHLLSRQETGRILRQESGALVIELRASIVIGHGSLSFEMIRALVEKLPLMITPKWVSVKAQPIFIQDLIKYMIASMDLPLESSTIVEVGGADRVSYADIMRTYAECRGMKMRVIPVPVLTPHLSSLWLGLVTPLQARIGRRLIDGVLCSTVIEDDSAARLFNIKPTSLKDAIRGTLKNEDMEFEAPDWYARFENENRPSLPARIIDSRTGKAKVAASDAFKTIINIGGETGWYAYNGLWRLRAFFDKIIGGVGMRRSTSGHKNLKIGDSIDFWRVENYRPEKYLRLRAEMKMPGRAWLEFEVTPDGQSSIIRQTAIFDPLGFAGRLYWHLLFPVHVIIFRGMLRGIVKTSEQKSRE